MRKLNKLLALVLAMVMALSLTATALAADEETGDKKEDTTAADNAAPAEGEEDKKDDAAPVEGEEDKKDEPAPSEGEEDKKDETPAEPDLDLSDVADWAKDDVAAVVNKKLIDMTQTGFNPNVPMTRGDLVLALYRLAGKPAVAEDVVNPFTDIADLSDEAKDAVAWAFSKEIVNGQSKTTFNPNGSVQRQQIAKILFVYAGDKAQEVSEDKLSAFSDKDAVASYAVSYLNWLVSTGLMQGSGSKLDPTGIAPRQQVAVILNRYINNILGEPAVPAEGDKTDADAVPTEGDKTDADAAPTEGDKTDADAVPAEGDKTDADAAPTEGDKTDAGAAPAEGDKE